MSVKITAPNPHNMKKDWEFGKLGVKRLGENGGSLQGGTELYLLLPKPRPAHQSVEAK